SERAALARYSSITRDGSKMTFSKLVALAQDGDEVSLNVLRETADYVGIGLGNVIQGLSPEAIVIGGTIAKAWDLIGDDVSRAVERVICYGVPTVKIIPST